MTPTAPTAGPRAVAVAPSVLREMNQRLLLDQLFTAGPATRPRLARDTGLSPPTVNAALTDLRNAGLARAAGRSDTAPGRPATVYEANPGAGHVVGVDIGRGWLRVIVADLAEQQLSSIELRNTARTAATLVERVGEAVAEATRVAGLDPSAITHTVIGSPGVYEPRRGRILYAANLPGWQRVGLAETLAARLGTSVTVDNDANLAALGEHRYGAGRDARHFVYAHIGTGVGLGLVLDGRLYQGFTGAAGEVGYLPFGDQLGPARAGRPQRGMLEESLAADAVVRYAHAAGMPAKITAEAVFIAARAGDERAQRAITIEATRLAQLLASIAALFDPELIVLGGGVGQNLDLLEPPARAAMAPLTPMTPRLAAGALGQAAVVRGAIAAGVRHAREIVFATNTTRTG